MTIFSKLFFSDNSEFDIKERSMKKKKVRCLQIMAGSKLFKLFSGDLPEISTYIIQNLRNNFNTLYSLALVNRFWCRLAIPLLWEDPFSIKYRSFHFLDTYF